MKSRVFFSMIFIVAMAASCTKAPDSTGNLYEPTAADVTASATLAELQQGRTLYINNCGSCHGLYSPDSFTATQWKNNIMPSMGPETSMNASQKSLVTKYVTRGK